VASSAGDLHVFLPLKDEGIDGIVHRISTDQYARVQVKARHRTFNALDVQVQSHELADDLACVIAVETRGGEASLGEIAVVAKATEFRELAGQYQTAHGPVYQARIPLPPPPGSPWAASCMPPQHMGERLLPPPRQHIVPAPPIAVPADWVAAGMLGFRAEMELLHRASDCGRLNVFKAFPDLEPNEYVMYDLDSRGLVGIQVKSLTCGDDSGGQMRVYRPAMRPSARTWFILFLEGGAAPTFQTQCAVIPSAWMAGHLEGHGDHGALWVTPGLTGRLARWCVPPQNLGLHLADWHRRWHDVGHRPRTLCPVPGVPFLYCPGTASVRRELRRIR
jgi:hypothetical protein